MAKTYPSGSAGAVALPTGFNADFASFTLRETQSVESVAFYGAGTYDPFRGSGTPHLNVQVGGFAYYGVTASGAGFGAMTAAGGTGTLTIATGVTVASSFVVSQIELQHGRTKAAVPVTFQMDNSSDTVTTTWATT